MNNPLKRLPSHVKEQYATIHDFRAEKRRCLRRVLRECDILRYGSAFTPAYAEISDAIDLLRLAQRKMSVKEWGK